MKTSISDRGFRFIFEASYPEGKKARLASESSAVGDYDDAFDNPGSSFLWIGDDHHLNREQVRQFVTALQHWLDHKRLPETL